MSESGPPDDPFGGMPFLGDLARMLQQQGSVSWDAARQLAMSIAVGGESEPNVEPLERMRIEQLARVAELQIAQATGLPTSATGQSVSVLPVTRAQWVQRSLDAYRPLFEQLAASLAPETEATGAPDDDEPVGQESPMAWLGGLMKMMGPMMLGMTAGSLLGHLARRSFGQYDLPVPRPKSDELLLVASNVDAFGEEWILEGDDLRLWVCLHEIAHHAVLGRPHVRQRLEQLLADYAAGFEPDSSALETRLADLDAGEAESLQSLQAALSDPEVLLGAIQSPAQRDLLPHLEGFVAVIVGYVDHVMDRVGGTLISGYDMITEAVRRRRVTEDPSDRFVQRLLGLDLTQAAYDRGGAFVAGVVERAGDDGLQRLWQSEGELPTPAEVDAPGLWLARIDLED